MLLLSLLPQFHLWLVRGREWNGAFVSSQGDEFYYSAYLNALISGRPRKNDPFAGGNTSLSSPMPESTFSIQLIPPYVISFLARTFGASASTAMIVLIAAAGFFASLSVFWLINALVQDHRLASVGTLFVLCLGGTAAGSGLIGIILNIDLGIPMLPFLRRYQPAAAFPLFFFFNMLVWYSLTGSVKRARICLALACVTLPLLIFSYLYLWTAAVAWVASIGALWLYFRPEDRRRTSLVLITIGVITSLALIPYGYLVSQRPHTLDEQQTLTLSHQSDLFRVPEIVGLVIIAALIIGIRRGRIQFADARVIYAASLAILPLLVFNQQVVTGRAMQPHHFALFVTNYAVLTSLVLGVTLLWKTILLRVLVWIGALSFSWGLVEVAVPARLATVPVAIANDRMIPVLLRLKQFSNQDGTLASLRGEDQVAPLVFSPNIHVSVLLPTWTSQGTLLDMGGLDFGSLSKEERKEFFLAHLYFSETNTESLRTALQNKNEDPEVNYYARSVIFGHERVLPVLSYDFQPIRSDEIEREVQLYQAYINSFSRGEALKRPIKYAVIPTQGTFDFSNLDRWYERDTGERVGDYTLYRLKLR